jgi:hypothetical protein
MKSPGCLGGSIGCLVLGLVLGALAVWLLIPRLTQEGYTPDRAAEKIEHKMEKISEYAEESARKVAEGADKIGEIKSNLMPEKPSKTVPATPPEPELVMP